MAAGTLAVLALGVGAVMAARAGGGDRGGVEELTEQLILGEIVAQTIARDRALCPAPPESGRNVDADRALLAGDVDVYVNTPARPLPRYFTSSHRPIGRASSRPSANFMRAADGRSSALSVSITSS